MKSKFLLVMTGVFALASAPVFGDTFLFSGDTTAGNIFNRPTEPGDALSDVGTAVHYYAQPFTVSLSGNYAFSATANDPSSFDTFIHLYSGSFNSGAPLGNLFGGNDDRVNGNPDLGSGFTAQPLTAGTPYVFVIDGFGNSDMGGFSASISGPGAITAVPEPSTVALAGLSLTAGMMALLRNGRRQ